MIFGRNTEERERYQAKWRLWFAWHPVRLDSGEWAFWENVARFKFGKWGYHEASYLD
jgi:hypothetical protein